MDPLIGMASMAGLKLLDSALGGVVGNKADLALNRVAQAARERLRSLKLPANHDLVRAIVRSQFQAAQMLLQTMQQATRGDQNPLQLLGVASDRSLEGQWLERLNGECRRALAEVERAELSADAYLLAEGLDVDPKALVEPRDREAAATAATEQFLSYLTKSLGPIPERIDALFRYGVVPYREERGASWFAAAGAFFAHELKTNQSVRVAFQNEILLNSEPSDATSLSDSIAETLASQAAALSSQLAAIASECQRTGMSAALLTEQVGHIAGRLDRHGEWLATLTRELESRAIPAKYAGLEIAERQAQWWQSTVREPFVGRDGELQAIRDVWQERAAGPVFIIAPAGMGKSALLANWVAQNHRLTTFAVYYRFGETKGFRSLTDGYVQLLRQLYEYYGVEAGAIPRSAGELRDTIYGLLRDGVPRSQETLTLVWDGVDEADEFAILPLPEPCPEHVRVVAGMRSGFEEAEPLAQDWLKQGTIIRLERLSHVAIRDWMQGQVPALTQPVHQGLLDKLVSAADGYPLYARHLLEDLKQRSPRVPAWDGRVPATFREYVAGQLKAIARQEGAAKSQTLLATLAVATGPLTTEEIEDLTSMSAWDLDALPWTLTRWLLAAPHGDTTLYSISHGTVAAEMRGHLARPCQAAERALQQYCERWRETKSRYALLFWCDHLWRAGRKQEVEDLLFDSSWLAAHLERFAGSEYFRGQILRFVDARLEHPPQGHQWQELWPLLLRRAEALARCEESDLALLALEGRYGEARELALAPPQAAARCKNLARIASALDESRSLPELRQLWAEWWNEWQREGSGRERLLAAIAAPLSFPFAAWQEQAEALSTWFDREARNHDAQASVWIRAVGLAWFGCTFSDGDFVRRWNAGRDADPQFSMLLLEELMRARDFARARQVIAAIPEVEIRKAASGQWLQWASRGMAGAPELLKSDWLQERNILHADEWWCLWRLGNRKVAQQWHESKLQQGRRVWQIAAIPLIEELAAEGFTEEAERVAAQLRSAEALQQEAEALKAHEAGKTAWRVKPEEGEAIAAWEKQLPPLLAAAMADGLVRAGRPDKAEERLRNELGPAWRKELLRFCSAPAWLAMAAEWSRRGELTEEELPLLVKFCLKSEIAEEPEAAAQLLQAEFRRHAPALTYADWRKVVQHFLDQQRPALAAGFLDARPEGRTVPVEAQREWCLAEATWSEFVRRSGAADDAKALALAAWRRAGTLEGWRGVQGRFLSAVPAARAGCEEVVEEFDAYPTEGREKTIVKQQLALYFLQRGEHEATGRWAKRLPAESTEAIGLWVQLANHSPENDVDLQRCLAAAADAISGNALRAGRIYWDALNEALVPANARVREVAAAGLASVMRSIAAPYAPGLVRIIERWGVDWAAELVRGLPPEKLGPGASDSWKSHQREIGHLAFNDDAGYAPTELCSVDRFAEVEPETWWPELKKASLPTLLCGSLALADVVNARAPGAGNEMVKWARSFWTNAPGRSASISVETGRTDLPRFGPETNAVFAAGVWSEPAVKQVLLANVVDALVREERFEEAERIGVDCHPNRLWLWRGMWERALSATWDETEGTGRYFRGVLRCIRGEREEGLREILASFPAHEPGTYLDFLYHYWPVVVKGLPATELVNLAEAIPDETDRLQARGAVALLGPEVSLVEALETLPGAGDALVRFRTLAALTVGVRPEWPAKLRLVEERYRRAQVQ